MQGQVTLKRRLVDYGLVALLLLLPAVMLTAHLKDPTGLNAFDKAVLRVSSPLQDAVSWVIEGVGGAWNSYVWLVDVEEENDELRAENRGLREQLAAAERRAEHTKALERLLVERDKSQAETVGARVVASTVNPYFRVVRIGIDRGDGVAPGMAVLSADGLVGRIHHAYGDYSDVLLSTDPQSSVDVVIERTEGRGVLTGVGTENSYACKIEYLERGKEVQVGDEVFTSGLGGLFPSGVPVGHISAITTKEYGLYQEVEVEPAVDFSALRRVLVVLAPPPPADPSAAGDKRSPRAYSMRPYQ